MGKAKSEGKSTSAKIEAAIREDEDVAHQRWERQVEAADKASRPSGKRAK